jgi:hypothetical protein
MGAVPTLASCVLGLQDRSGVVAVHEAEEGVAHRFCAALEAALDNPAARHGLMALASTSRDKPGTT